MISVSTPFDPKVHGFRFVNCFDFPDLFNINPSYPPFSGFGDIVYGLCGGMCYAALDYYQAGKPVPTENDVESIPLKLFKYLWARQMNTLTLPVLEKLVSLALLKTKPLHKKIAQDEVDAVKQSIGSNRPCVLVLVRSSGLLKMTQNHQVLATGYTFDPTTNDMTIQLYDPNYPGMVPELTMNLTRPGSGIKLAESSGDSLRGFFMIDYRAVSPP